MPVLYHGNCHCGRYRFELTLPGDLAGVISCPCSLCRKKGYLLLETPAESLRVVKDDSALVDYRGEGFGDKFCGYCGTGVMIEHLVGSLQGKVMVNIRTLRDVNPFQIEDSIIKLPTEDVAQSLRVASSGLSTPPHVFSCHCGAVHAELLVPLGEYSIKEDNCSSCVRNAYISLTPTKPQVILHGQENTFEYRYNREFTGLSHCRTCGVLVYKTVYGPPVSVFDKLPPERKEKALEVYHRNMAMQPLNVRALNELDLGELKIERSDEGTEGYELD